MKRSLLLPGVAVLAGIAGFFLRRRALVGSAASADGPALMGTASLALIALSVLLALALTLGCLRMAFSRGYAEAFAVPGPVGFAAALVSAGLAAAAGICCFLEFSAYVSEFGAPGLTKPGNPLISRGVLGLAALLCCFALIRQGLRAIGRGKQPGKYSASVQMPAFLCCIWLFAVYQSRAADPIILGYIYMLLAVMACALTGYFIAGFMYEKPKPRLTAVFGLMAVYLCGVCLSESGDLIGRLLLVAMGLHLLVNVAALLRNAERPRSPAPAPRETEESFDEA